jgi:PhnB protein
MKLSPYLNFNGTCESAFEFYAKVFDGELSEISRYDGAPLPIPSGMEQKVMHVSLKFEDNEFMGSDDLQANEMPINSQIMLSFMEVFVMDRVFSDLSEGGEITMPLQDTFWGARFGTITDKFGIRWMFNCDLN